MRAPVQRNKEMFSSVPALDLNAVVSGYRRSALIAIEMTFLVASSLLLAFIIGNASTTLVLALVVNALLNALGLGFAWKRRNAPSAYILSAQFLVIPTYLAYRSLGTFDSAILVYPAGVVAVSIVARPRGTMVFAGLTMACIGFLCLATIRGWVGESSRLPMTPGNMMDVITAAVLVGFSAAIGIYVSTIFTRLLHTLAMHQESLEERIRVRTQELEQANSALQRSVKRLDEARAELVRGEKLAGLGKLVAGVAHELNTPVGNAAVTATALKDYTVQFQRQVEAGTLKKSDLNQFLVHCLDGTELIETSTRRAADLVSSFKLVAVDQTSDRKRAFALDQVVQDVVRSIRPSFKGQPWNIECEVEPGIDCNGFPGPLGQVVTNLVQNAILHGFKERSHGTVVVRGSRVDANTALISVEDDGVGIPANDLDKVFDPFFTTRLGQGGSGLGLTIVHNLVTARLQGQIALHSAAGQGTRFEIRFPTQVTEDPPA